MTPAGNDWNAAFAASGQCGSGYRRHFGFEHKGQHILCRNCGGAPVFLAALNDETISLEANMAPARDLQEPF